MNRYLAIGLFAMLILDPFTVQAVGQTDRWQLAIKYATIEFVGKQAENNAIKRGSFSALEAYFKLQPGYYIGGEIGGTSIENGSTVNLGGTLWEADFEYLSIEMNAKTIRPLTGWLDVEAGLGLALVEAGNAPRYFAATDYTETYFGAQGFAGLNVIGEHWYTGIDAKYQLVEDYYSNWRGGVHLGYRFD